MTRNIAIWGAGGHALVVHDILQSDRNVQVKAVLVDPEHAASCSTHLKHLLVIGFEECERMIAAGTQWVVAIGDNKQRLATAQRLQDAGASFYRPQHEAAWVACSARIAAGTVIGAKAIVGAHAVVGEHTIINSGAIVEHQCVLGAGVHVSPGAQLAGNVRVGDRSWIGIGATVIQGLTIGADAVVGAGAVVLKPVPAFSVAVGVPAKVVHQLSR